MSTKCLILKKKKNSQKQHCCRLMMQPCKQRQSYATTQQNKHVGAAKGKMVIVFDNLKN